MDFKLNNRRAKGRILRTPQRSRAINGLSVTRLFKSVAIVKSPERVPKHYKQGTKDWANQYSMLLHDGFTCGNNCVHAQKCITIFGQDEDDTSCQFFPSRFYNNGKQIP